MKECPYCYTKVAMTDVTCPNCGRQIEHWLKVKNLKHPTMRR